MKYFGRHNKKDMIMPNIPATSEHIFIEDITVKISHPKKIHKILPKGITPTNHHLAYGQSFMVARKRKW
jgi:hypothetical protein